ncbi:protein-tyrosine-phosphatase MKP1-like [Vigna umbellata]|uniref:protein-tyrosine-phosphatase MKP1-like n=1 Tax=Vigna umbellata TaxID=87088 RepID=UPI001F5F61B9|nr:protein-tyrosine-phosphatase MKP1-like [Vigna umbellata]
MLGEESNNADTGVHWRAHSRSVSWTDQTPVVRKPPRSLQPLCIRKDSVKEWPSAGSDDLEVWLPPPTPRGSTKGSSNLGSGSGQVFQLRRDKLAFYDKECSKIAEHVYLGSDTVAKNEEVLRRHGITHVLNCVGFVCPEYFKSDFVYKTLWLRDSPSEDITSILYDVFDYFEDVRQQGGRVLVHCCQGVSRSTSLVIAYLMWRENQSFEDAFHIVKNARGIINPNMGFACQLLQCQKRVHATPPSPSSVLRMYRMAPHSPYDPLHLVPKMVNNPCAHALDSRGAFIVHVSCTLYVWVGKECGTVMCCKARHAAAQVVRYERATGEIVTVVEDEEPEEFWVALSHRHEEVKNVETMEVDVGIHPRRVEEYDLDFGIFHKALSGGVVPPFSLSKAGSENCLPSKENGWGRLTWKLSGSTMKGFTSSNMNIVEENHHMNVDPLPSSSKPFYDEDASDSKICPLLQKEGVSSSPEAFLANQTLVREESSLAFKGSKPSFAECRGTNLPPRTVLLSTGNSKVRVRSKSISLPALDDTLLSDVSCEQFDHENSAK